jgi:chemosensory pili system protein ChpA (sensor histidine kinase/response regulator)
MTTPSSALPQGARDNFDTGPLSWVMGEIREALTRSKTALHEAVTQDAEARSTSLRHAKSYLHQAHGALQIVDVDGVAIITETIEDLLDRVESAQLALTEDLAQSIANGYQALIEYLEELLSGASHQPVRLFPYYRSLLQARGAERIHPADLFFPNLAIRPHLPIAASAATANPGDYAGLRQRFERALLPFLKSTDRQAEMTNAALMRDLIAEIEQRQSNQQSRGFWWVMHGFADVVSAGQVLNEIYVKQLFARINLQIRRLSQGSSSTAERLLRDALFFIAQARNPSLLAQQIRTAYQLNGVVPADYEKKHYGQIDVAALGAAKERLSHAKTMWNRIAGGDFSVADSFEHEMRGLAEAGSKLNPPAFSKLLRELSGIARHAAHASPGDSLGLEMATSLLFVENSLNQIGRLSDNFAERAEAMTARLLSIVSGEMPTESAQWLDDMSREAQQRQTMTALAGELQSSLRQVEKMLDEYFRDPSQRAALGQLDSTLHQIEGALAILDQNDAMHAVLHTRAAVQRFAQSDPEAEPDQREFQKVAQNIGALSFFIESLQLSEEGARKRFSFDSERGVFRASLLEKNAAPAAVLDEAAQPRGGPEKGEPDPFFPEAPVLPTVEEELAHHQRQSAELALSLTAEPENTVLQEQLKESLQQIHLDATLIDNPEAGDRAKAGIEVLKRPDFAASQDALADIISATVPVQAPAESQPLPAVVSPATDEAVDAELLEIFLMEAEEVLACVKETVPESRTAPHSQEHLTTLRRSFHTLKGSGRMVGLMAFGEAAWSIEQVMNQRLSESRGGDADLYALLDKAAEVLSAWVEDLKLRGRSDRTPHAIVVAAERMQAGGTFEFEADSARIEPVEAVADVTQTPAPALEVDAGPAEPAIPIEAAIDLEPTTDLELVTEPELATDVATIAEVEATIDARPTIDVETTIDVEPEPAAPQAMDEIAIDGMVEDASPALPEVQEIQLSDADLAMFHSTDIVSFPNGVEQKHAAEVVEPAIPAPPIVSIAEVIEFPSMVAPQATHDDNVKRIGDLEISVPLHNIYLAETDELVRLLSQDIGEWRHEPERHVTIQSVHAAHSLAGSSATVGFRPLQEVAHALEMVLQFLSRKPVRLTTPEFDTLEHSVERLKLMLQKFALCEMPAHEPEYVRRLVGMLRNVEQRSEFQYEAPAIPPATGIVSPPVELHSVKVNELELPAAWTLPENHGDDTVTERPSAHENLSTPDAASLIKDDLDADLLPVFIEEGRDMLPQMGQGLRSWQEQPGNAAAPHSLLRLLHTLKGSARMAGAMQLGQHFHEMETRIENLMRMSTPSPQAIEDLLIRYDHALHLFEELQNPVARNATAPAMSFVKEDQSQAAEAGAATEQPTNLGPVVLAPLMPALTGQFVPAKAPIAKPAAAVAPVPLVRVRADILDRLVNQAGEVSISRSKLETEVGTLRQSLSELTENVSRLRDQLREIEMQAETQITSRMAHSADREFDPLEFDRFTRLQELTRMMAESVNDVGSVQQNLSRTLESATGGLTIQARLTRDLQQDLMRVRMVQFASISERLYRVTRQTAKELDKRVNLDIRGSAVEVDRGVLEKMTGPFEHLLRNAIVHGIESREARRAAGKDETGELLIEIRQEGNEVVIQFTDDGQGLNLDNIRKKARNTGLLTDDRDLSDEEVRDLIFHPGFSTAEAVTELAGRGVGMDVVRSEAAALGGRVSTWSESGKGAQFTIHLPLTLAVTQVALLISGGKTYAVPSVLVEQVQQLKANPLAAAYNDGAVVWQGHRVPLYYLPGLLGDRNAAPMAQHYSPMMILKSGNDRVAIHVDEIIGNREVVVKNIGPQLARMIGVAGATVLGSGEIVLILNPVPLAQRAVHELARAPRLIPSSAPESMGAVAEMAGSKPTLPAAGPVQGLRRQSIVMVVDDSLTVRRVTQRLLTREGYHVVLAKDGVDALEHLQSVSPDVMLVDIEMPRMDGFDLTRNVRDDERTRRIPIIMITSRTAEKHRNYAMELGVNEYLGKPYQEERLLRLVAGFIKKDVPVT